MEGEERKDSSSEKIKKSQVVFEEQEQTPIQPYQVAETGTWEEVPLSTEAPIETSKPQIEVEPQPLDIISTEAAANHLSAPNQPSSSSLVYVPSYIEENVYDNMSSISFNTRILEQHLRLGDSVSQIGAGDITGED